MTENIFEEVERLKKRLDGQKEYWENLGWFKLYHDEYRDDGYKDQYGIWHWAHVLDAEVEVQVVKTYYYVDYGSTMLGAIAVDKDGNEYKHQPSAIDMNDDWWSGNKRSWYRFPHGLVIDKEGNQLK
jgi:hypothetical protein